MRNIIYNEEAMPTVKIYFGFTKLVCFFFFLFMCVNNCKSCWHTIVVWNTVERSLESEMKHYYLLGFKITEREISILRNFEMSQFFFTGISYVSWQIPFIKIHTAIRLCIWNNSTLYLIHVSINYLNYWGYRKIWTRLNSIKQEFKL